MERLLKMAQKVCDQAEVYSMDSHKIEVVFDNGKLKNIEQKLISGTTLRIIKDEKQGFSYTRNLNNMEILIKNALDSLKGGAQAPDSFADTKEIPALNTWDSSAKSITSKILADECLRIGNLVKKNTIGQFVTAASFNQTDIRILNSLGMNLKSKSSEYNLHPMILYPESFSSINRLFSGKRFFNVSEKSLYHIVSLFNAAQKEARPKGGRMQILFLPETLTSLLMRIAVATNGQMVFQKQSPLINRINEKIFDEKLTIRDNPLDVRYPGARAFDDEGTLCRPLTIVNKGVLKNFFTDRFYAEKLCIPPTGHGYKAGGAGDPISFKPSPMLCNLNIEPGDKSINDMIASMDRGIIVAADLGAHTGNVPGGDFSLGLSPGLYVEDGKITGYVKDAMIAGNIYESLNKIISIENRQHATRAAIGGQGNWRCPAVLVDDVNMAIN